MRGIPAAEVDVDEPLVRRLLQTQAPHLSTLTLHSPRNGWDNRIWRLGDELAVRLPRRDAAAQLLLHEQRWLGGTARRLPLPAPAPLVAGRPDAVYPWAWSVVPWFAGEVASRAAPSPDQAPVLGRFLAALHVDADDDAPVNPFRGVPLAARLPWVEHWLAVEHPPEDAEFVSCAADLVVRAASEQPDTPQRVWLHGDLHPRNILVREGLLAAVLDWGDMCGGDPATDLATVWWLFDLEQHAAFWAAYADRPHSDRPYADRPHSDRPHSNDLGAAAMWHRSRAWAAVFGLMFLHFASADDPSAADAEAADLGRAMLRRVLAPQQPAVG